MLCHNNHPGDRLFRLVGFIQQTSMENFFSENSFSVIQHTPNKVLERMTLKQDYTDPIRFAKSYRPLLHSTPNYNNQQQPQAPESTVENTIEFLFILHTTTCKIHRKQLCIPQQQNQFIQIITKI